jgi:hypothetical protein
MWFLDALLTGPTIPGTIVLGVCAVYWLLLIAGAVDLDLGDVHIGMDGHGADFGHGGGLDHGGLDHGGLDHAGGNHGGLGHGGHGHGGTSWGLVALRFLNIGDVPLMIWLTAFSAGYVASSVLFDGTATGLSAGAFAVGVVRSGAIGLVAAKLLTQPLRGAFETVEPNRAASLVGRTCVVTTSEVTDRFGQAKVEAEGAPLLLHVRGAAGALKKNDLAVIAAYDAERRVFLVEPVAENVLTESRQGGALPGGRG